MLSVLEKLVSLEAGKLAPLIDLDMSKYIDAEKLKAHIQYIIKKDNYELFDVPELLSFIDSLQQEQLDIDEIKREWYNKGYLEGRKNAHIPARELGLPKSCDFHEEQPEVDLEKEIEDHSVQMPMSEFTHDREVEKFIEWAKKEFRHFYELGKLNARKEENK